MGRNISARTGSRSRALLEKNRKPAKRGRPGRRGATRIKLQLIEAESIAASQRARMAA